MYLRIVFLKINVSGASHSSHKELFTPGYGRRAARQSPAGPRLLRKVPPQNGDQWGSLTGKYVGWGGPIDLLLALWAGAPGVLSILSLCTVLCPFSSAQNGTSNNRFQKLQRLDALVATSSLLNLNWKPNLIKFWSNWNPSLANRAWLLEAMRRWWWQPVA